MFLERGDMFENMRKDETYLVTTNSFIRRDGALVMGRGAALRMKEMWPGIDRQFGNLIPHMDVYGVILQNVDGQELGIFQVKHHFRDPAELTLIAESTRQLTFLAEMSPSRQFNINFPGIGNGRLRRSEVEPIIQQLPDNVKVWTL